MPAYFNQGFSVREIPWHGMGEVLDYYPGREEAMRLAGHDFRVVERPVEVVGMKRNHRLEDWKALVKTGDGTILNVCPVTYTVLQNDVGWDLAELLFDAGFKYETGVTLEDGRLCAITLRLDEPIRITGDDSKTLPYGWVNWSHDGSASLNCGTGTIRVVCANTSHAAEMESKGLKTSFTFRHTKNALARIEDAKAAVRGARATMSVFQKMAEELATIPVTPAERDLFVSTIIGERGGRENAATASARVLSNIEGERAKVNAVFMSKTMPEAHKLTGYGLFLAGTEYADHLRKYRSQDSYVKRTLLQTNPFKANLNRTIREICAAAV